MKSSASEPGLRVKIRVWVSVTASYCRSPFVPGKKIDFLAAK